jgi:hypothetical protein
MTLAIVGIGFAFLVVMILLSRMGRHRKRQALEDFDREREAVKPPDILQLVQDEVVDLGIDKIDGAESIDPSVLLQVYRRDVENCADGAEMRFIIADGVEPADADQDTLSLSCDD